MKRALALGWPFLAGLPLVAAAALVAGNDGPGWASISLAFAAAALWFWTAIRAVRAGMDREIARNVEASGKRFDAMIQAEAARRSMRYRPTDGSDMTTSARNMTGPEDE